MVPQIAPDARAAPEARPAQGQQHQHEMAQIDDVELAQPAVIDAAGSASGPARPSRQPGAAGLRGRAWPQGEVVSLTNGHFPWLHREIFHAAMQHRLSVGSLRNPFSSRHHDRPARRDKPWLIRHLCRPFDRGQVERALPHQPGARADRPVGRLRSADPDRLRLRPSAGQGRGRQGRRADQPSRRHARPCSTASRSTA